MDVSITSVIPKILNHDLNNIMLERCAQVRHTVLMKLSTLRHIRQRVKPKNVNIISNEVKETFG